ncbi:N-acetylglucosamine-6-phosphate deacetylase [Nesterenkonia muleiensis]|uniref:N-acetylglucosamine-6-phosphate deacetylase n=1 Tax=Nesterenkonia muleiensis TaxID=2282648 RepID=UPI001EE4BA72|nr:amidohydrolase family protein [Nesterenkonia muleiensis]
MPGGGYTDIHTHGAVGCSYDSADYGQVAAALDFHHQHGTSDTLLSLVSAPPEQLAARLRRLRSTLSGHHVISGVAIHGVHVEGPFLAPARAGAHAPQALREPSPSAVETLLEAGEGILRQVTLAPELPGAMEAIDRFSEAGVLVAVGHTAADYDITAEAFDRGASLLTHALNAMPGLEHRAPGPLGAALDRDHVGIEVIADGVHVHRVLIRTLFAAAPDRVILVTDSMAAAGLGDGTYRLGGLDVEVRDGIPLLADARTLAGSTLTMDVAVGTAIAAGVPAQQAKAAASTVPARFLGFDH